jgi:two-component system, NarL family, sensor histidine kinase DevS
MTSFLGVPIRAGNVPLGQIYLTDKIDAPEFTADDEKIIQMLAAYAAAAIQNARLHENTHRLAVLEERERIGMDLHDGIIQSIYGVGLSLESALHSFEDDPRDAKARVQHSIESLNQAIRDLRAYILDLRPRQMGSEGLMNGLLRLISEFRANTLAKVQLSGNDNDIKDLPQAYSMVLFHICQEALANTAKHAKAKQVDISLWTTDERVLMEIHDNGKGFEMEKMNASIGHGVANMQTRARSIGGDVDISSVVGEGTTVLAWVPRHAQR